MRTAGVKLRIVAGAACFVLAVLAGLALLSRGNGIVVEVPPVWQNKVDVIATRVDSGDRRSLARAVDGTFVWDRAPAGSYVVVVTPRVIEDAAGESVPSVRSGGPAPRGPDDPEPPPRPLTAPVGHRLHFVEVSRWRPTVIRTSPVPLDDAATVRIDLKLDRWESFGRGLESSGDVNFNDAGKKPKQHFRVSFAVSGVELALKPLIMDGEHYEYLLEPGEYRLRTEPGNAVTLRLKRGERRAVSIVDGMIRDVE